VLNCVAGEQGERRDKQGMERGKKRWRDHSEGLTQHTPEMHVEKNIICVEVGTLASDAQRDA